MNQNNLLETASFSPKSLQSPNAWVGHLPFAAWVMQQVSPKIFVELGTHSGNSYFSFCQSVVENGLSCKCYAVDTWQGDEHAGQYSDEIFALVNAHNQEHYAGFSRLLRMTFDDAVTYFADGSIDLLHIDGLHTYEAVHHDFETWLPKLAPGAVVMFHDTNVRERDFGVWKLWAELKARYPNNLEFMHCNGLGVLQLNHATGEQSLEWLQQTSTEKNRIIGYFSALGSGHLTKFDLKELKEHIENLAQVIIGRDEQIGILKHAMTTSEQKIEGLNLALDQSKTQIKLIEKSLSWRITKPLRKMFGKASPLTIMGLRATKLVWWLITFQLVRRLREWNAIKNMKSGVNGHIAPPTDDHYFAIPFNYSLEKLATAPTVAVIFHIYYPEMLAEFKKYLSNIPFSYDLFITTDSDQKKNEITKGLSDWKKCAVEIRVVRNQGRDIAPKLIACHDVYASYEYFLHIHTKKSPQLEYLAGWRTYLLETLLGSENIVLSIFDAFDSDPKLGMVAPEHFDKIRPGIGWGLNFDEAKDFACRLELKLAIDNKIDFPSGSMFWGRSAAIKPLLEKKLNLDDFHQEDGQVDGTLGHIIERLYFFICEQASYRWIKIGCPDLLKDTKKKLIVENKASLVDFIKKYQYGLLASNIKDRSDRSKL